MLTLLSLKDQGKIYKINFFTCPTGEIVHSQSACIVYRRKLGSNPLAWLVILFELGHRLIE